MEETKQVVVLARPTWKGRWDVFVSDTPLTGRNIMRVSARKDLSQKCTKRLGRRGTSTRIAMLSFVKNVVRSLLDTIQMRRVSDQRLSESANFMVIKKLYHCTVKGNSTIAT